MDQAFFQCSMHHRSFSLQPNKTFTIAVHPPNRRIMPLILSLIQTSLGKKYLSAASGLLLGGFLLVHLTGNAASFFGKDAFNAYAAHLHGLGPLRIIPETALALAFAVHVGMGVLLFIKNRKARPCRYAVNSPRPAQVNATTMTYTGMVILIFILVHLFQFHFARHATTVSGLVTATLSQPAIGLFYLFSLTALGLHLSHGLWGLMQSFGITHPRYFDFFVISGQAGGILISTVFMLIVILALLSDSFLR